jgi:hypothetical protein
MITQKESSFRKDAIVEVCFIGIHVPSFEKLEKSVSFTYSIGRYAEQNPIQKHRTGLDTALLLCYTSLPVLLLW